MLPGEEVAAFVYLMASQRVEGRLVGLESVNASVLLALASSAFRKRSPVQSRLYARHEVGWQPRSRDDTASRRFPR